jgi:hypothetical protein
MAAAAEGPAAAGECPATTAAAGGGPAATAAAGDGPAAMTAAREGPAVMAATADVEEVSMGADFSGDEDFFQGSQG